jgi:N-acetylgalactosamine-N,N'-diacetylbacillosaminyl-diphospho-undecaprenol 4-alpha-N-acetylgalactosaminyltransferase
MKVLFLVNSFKRGGAERVIINLLNYLPELNPSLQLHLYFLEYAVDPYPVPSHVHLREVINKSRYNYSKLLNLSKQAFELKKYAQTNKIDIIISFLTRSNYVNIISKLLGSDHNAVMSERNTTSKMYQGQNFSSIINRILIRKLYSRYSKIIAVSEGVKRDLIDNFSISDEKISVIYNPYDIDQIKKEAKKNVDHKWLNDPRYKTIVSVGRLEKAKNHSMLIRAFALVSKKMKNTRLIIIGEGIERAVLTQLVNELNLNDKIDLVGQKDNPFAYSANADLFVLSSLSEGFPNVLIEAMICGCPVISTNCKSGPNEIINNMENGILVPVGDIDKLSDSIVTLLQDEILCSKLINAAKKSVLNFEISKIARQYYQKITENHYLS